MTTLETQMQQFKQAQQLRSWAEFFGFQLEMGREDDKPWITVDGVRFEGDGIDSLIMHAAIAMGLDEP